MMTMVRHNGRISWVDRLMILLFFTVALLFMSFFDRHGAEERNILLKTLENLHHEHCISCEGHNHNEAHYNTKAHIDATKKDVETASGAVDVQL